MAAAVCLALAAATFCVWAALCFTFWQGNWQLLYHPKSAVTRTPANLGLPFDSIDFAATESGQPQLHGWWVPGGPDTRFTTIYLHGADGNTGDTVQALIPLHAANLNLFVFDYRGYGESRFERPSELHWRQDTESAIKYLTDTRHIAPNSIVLAGTGLGANLALEEASAHPELAGVVLNNPLQAPEDAVFNDPRARIVPAHWLVRDRWDMLPSAANLKIPSLWFVSSEPKRLKRVIEDEAYERVQTRKMRVWLADASQGSQDDSRALTRWLDELPERRKAP